MEIIKNKVYLLKKVFSKLKVEDFILTNADGDLDQEVFFFGEIRAVTPEVIYVKRNDGVEGGGEGEYAGLWEMCENETSKICVFDSSLYTVTRTGDLKPGDTFSEDGELFIFNERLFDGFTVGCKSVESGEVERKRLNTHVKVYFKHPSVKCEHCSREVEYFVSGKYYCSTHYNKLQNLSRCHTCGTLGEPGAFRVVESENDEEILLCNVCHTEYVNSSKIIHCYSYKPSPNFIVPDKSDQSISNKIFMGIEQEVECPDSVDVGSSRFYSRNRGTVENLGNAVIKKFTKDNKWFYLKSDGSLSNGFELVTHPATLKGHYSLPWEDVCRFYKETGIKADNTDTCGLHIHVNKNIMAEEHQISLAYFVNSQREIMEKIARRSANRWAKYKRANHPIKELHKSAEKYEALNWTPSKTVEFRLFKGTVDFETLLSTIEFVHAAVLFSKDTTVDVLRKKEESWVSFIRFIENNGYQHIMNYLDKKGVLV